MRILIALSRIIVGVLFIFSGLIKLNDPIGFSFKLGEYFNESVLNLPFLEPYVLPIAILIVLLEVLLGVFLLLGYKSKFTVWSLLVLIVFFTFLTFYSAYFNKVTDCGCFGDAISLTPWQSFTKDVILLVFILVLVSGIQFIKPIFQKITTSIVVLLAFLFCLWLPYHVLLHLPIVDFRPYKVGANIIENMTVPENAAKPIVEYSWKFKVNGETEIITTNGSYPTVENGTFIDVETDVISEGYIPPIHDFTLEQDGVNYAMDILKTDKLIMIVAYNLAKAEPEGLLKLNQIIKTANKNNYKTIVVTASSEKVKAEIEKTYNFNADFYFSDETALKTIVRSNPGILKIENGTITQKLHWYDADALNF